MSEGNVGMEMPKYKSHKEVCALKIEGIIFDKHIAEGEGRETTGKATIIPADERYARFEVSAEYVSKHNPQPDGYYVVYEDSYKSFSPAKAFEDGYNLIKKEKKNE